MLAVGNAPDDRIRRLTCGEDYTCCYGSEKEHHQLTTFCEYLQELLKSSGLQLRDFSPEELGELLNAYVREETES